MNLNFYFCFFALTIGLVTSSLTVNFIAYAQLPPPSQQMPGSGTPLKPGDRLRLTVIGFPEISGTQTVMSDGGLQIPLAGYVNVLGLTPTQATEAIKTALYPYIRRPEVSLAIEGLSPVRVSVTGEVNKTGPIVLDTPTDSLSGENTLSEALSLAGGVTPNADLGNIIIRRPIYTHRDSASEVASSGEFSPGTSTTAEEMKVDLLQLIRNGDLSVDIPIYHGDEIIIPTSTQLTGTDQQALLSSTIAPNMIRVNVGGQVNQPGIIEIPPNSNVSSAVAAAGGLTRDGTTQNIVLFRTLPDGTMENYVYDLGEDSIVLKNGDAIIVSQSSRSEIENFVGIIGEVLNPFSWILNLFN